jgi:beta-glucuronidase
LLTALAFFAGIAFAAEQAPHIQNVSRRQTVSLDRQWRAIVDPYQSGYLDYRYRPYADGGMGANKKPASTGDLVEYEFDAAGQLAVPGDWNTQRPDLLFYEGAVWYKKDFDCLRKPGRRQFVWFGAANYHAIVFLNGKKLGEHVGGFTPFQFEITSLLREKWNFLIVMVDDERHAERVPPLMTD